MKTFGNALNKIESLFGYIGGILLMATTVVVILGIVCRRIFFYSLPWSEELCKYMFVWLVFLSFSLCVRNHMQIKIDVLESSIKSQVIRTCMHLVYDIVSLIFVCIYIYCSVQLVKAGTLSVSPAMHLPMWIVYLAMPVGLCLSAIEFVRQIFLDITELIRKRGGEVQ